MKIWTIVVAAGSGSRYGGPKQFDLLGGKRLIDWSVDVAKEVSDGVVVVVPEDLVSSVQIEGTFTVQGGDSRTKSVRNGLAAVPADVAYVLVHDAARPLASKDLFLNVIRTLLQGHVAVTPGIKPVDTIKRVNDSHRVVETIDREELVAVQTPQGFSRSALAEAHSKGAEGTDDVQLIEAGASVVVVEGELDNMKITFARDLAIAEALLKL